MGVLAKFILLLLLVLVSPAAVGDAAQLAVDYERSYIAVRTGKAGLFSIFGLGHKHGILAREWSADICFNPENIPTSSTAVTVATPSLKIDTAEARRRAELDPGGGPGREDVREIQQKMLGAQNLASQEHPEIEFQSTSAELVDSQTFLLRGSLSIRDQRQTVALRVSFKQLDGGVFRFSGTFPVRQTSYGIEPESVAGVVNVKDKVSVHFDIYASPTSETCE